MKRTRKAAILLAFVLVLSMVLTACGGGKEGDGGKKSGLDWHKNIGRTDLNAQLFTDPITFDPQMITSSYDAGVAINIYDALFEFLDDDSNTPGPCLCTSYEMNESGTDFVFHIRKGVTFQNGDPMTAEDVAFTINRLTTSPVTAVTYGGINHAEVVDDYTVHVTCNYPVFRLTSMLAGTTSGIVNKKLIEQYGDSAPETIVGTGAYKMENWTPGQGVKLVAYNEGWRGAPVIQTINYTVILDTNAARIAFLNGELDAYYATSRADLEMIEGTEGIYTSRYSLATGDHLAFNTTRPWVSELKFRQACAYAINRDELVKIVADGMWTKAESLVSPDNMVFDGKEWSYEYNPEKAKELLKEIGYDGSPIGLLYTATYPASNAWGTSIEAYLRAVGINVDPQGWEYANVIENWAARNFDLVLFEFAVSMVDPLSSFYGLYMSQGYYNVWCYGSEEIDGKVLSMYGMQDPELIKACQELDQMNEDLCLMVPNYFQGGFGCYPLNSFNTGRDDPMFGHVRICYSHWGDEEETQKRIEELAAREAE